MDFLNAFFVLLNVALYMVSGYIFIQVLLFLKANYLARFTSGKLSMSEIGSIVLGLVILVAGVIYGPQLIARSIGQGWNNFMPEMTLVTNQIVEDIAGLMSGNKPVYFETQTTSPSTSTYTQPSYEPFVVPGEPVGGGDPLADPNAGGGAGQADPNTFYSPPPPTPTPYIPPPPPTPTPFNPESWNPSMPPPTPVITPRP